MKYLRLPALVGLGLMGWMPAGMADDYTYLFNPATMQVGQTVGEYLVVKDRCPTDKPCADKEKLKYVTAVAGRTGRLEIPVNAGSDFEISFNIYDRSGGNNDLTITLYLSDDHSLPLIIYYFGGEQLAPPDGSPGGIDLNWKAGINDFRLISEHGTLKISANDVFADLRNVKLTLNGTITRIVMSKIDEGQEDLFEIRTRGIQKSGAASCPTTTTTTTPPTTTPAGNCTANYVPASGRLTIPCVAVPVTLPFGGSQVQNYTVEMQQRAGAFVFDLDLNTVKQQ
jgi:hypothetical protein